MTTERAQKKSAGKRVYMHTLDGKPAQYLPGQQVQFAPRTISRFAESVRQIRKEQIASEAWRAKRGLDVGIFRHGYISVRLP